MRSFPLWPLTAALVAQQLTPELRSRITDNFSRERSRLNGWLSSRSAGASGFARIDEVFRASAEFCVSRNILEL